MIEKLTKIMNLRYEKLIKISKLLKNIFYWTLVIKLITIYIQ